MVKTMLLLRWSRVQFEALISPYQQLHLLLNDLSPSNNVGQAANEEKEATETAE